MEKTHLRRPTSGGYPAPRAALRRTRKYASHLHPSCGWVPGAPPCIWTFLSSLPKSELFSILLKDARSDPCQTAEISDFSFNIYVFPLSTGKYRPGNVTGGRGRMGGTGGRTKACEEIPFAGAVGSTGSSSTSIPPLEIPPGPPLVKGGCGGFGHAARSYPGGCELSCPWVPVGVFRRLSGLRMGRPNLNRGRIPVGGPPEARRASR